MVNKKVMAMEALINNLTITNPRKNWVVEELEKLIKEWENWQIIVLAIEDYKYDKQLQTEVYADGEENMQRHSILQMKTVTFLDNNTSAHWFIHGRNGRNRDRKDLRLKYRVKHRLLQLKEIYSSLQYALLTDSFWKQKGKEMIDKISDKSPEVAMEIVASYLKNPLDISE